MQVNEKKYNNGLLIGFLYHIIASVDNKYETSEM